MLFAVESPPQTIASDRSKRRLHGGENPLLRIGGHGSGAPGRAMDLRGAVLVSGAAVSIARICVRPVSGSASGVIEGGIPLKCAGVAMSARCIWTNGKMISPINLLNRGAPARYRVDSPSRPPHSSLETHNSTLPACLYPLIPVLSPATSPESILHDQPRDTTFSEPRRSSRRSKAPVRLNL
ncbi:uncharacterized protein LOC124158830 [Ischnura elegans]|uniref:uncharacterized protein LOC124158815 n=1 Tax=Ischnura elegans TaxID=197161 RepID=UPI001ED8667A|nr:uncharacterized protein LOC124158815 [Ischnura elegans]XP_046390137.1 uncharacterized protein LOC124158830 [Ischnura elegans]